jgi:hypothetical protein
MFEIKKHKTFGTFPCSVFIYEAYHNTCMHKVKLENSNRSLYNMHNTLWPRPNTDY